MSLAERVVRVPILGLDTQSDPKGAPAGRLALAENVMATRIDGQAAIEVVKRNGFTSLSRNIQGGGSLSTGAKIQAFGNELIATDGQTLYSWSPSASAWLSRGRLSSVAARVSLIDFPTSASPVVDSAAFGNYVVTVVARVGFGTAAYYVRDATTGAAVGSGFFFAEAPRVVAVGTSAFIFFHELSFTDNLCCRTISASTPSTLGAQTTVATNLNRFAGAGQVFDVIVDTTNSRMVVGYRNTIPTTTLMIWNTNMTAGTAVAYATRDPSTCLGFLKHDFANGSGYVAIGTAADVRLLTFGASSMTVTADVQVDSTVTTAQAATGEVVSGTTYVIFTVPGAGAARTNDRTKGWNGTTLFELCRGAGLASRSSRVNGKFYFLAYHHPTNPSASQGTEKTLYLLEWNGTASTTGDSGVSVAGFLLAGDSGGRTGGTTVGSGLSNVLPSFVTLSATHLQVGCSRVLDPGRATNLQFVAAQVDLTFDDTQLGGPVAYNGTLHAPGAAAKVFDGLAVYEEGFYSAPEVPTLSAGAGGAMTAGARQVFGRWVRKGQSGRIERSVEGEIATVTLTAGNQTITGTFPAYRITDSDARYNTNQLVSSGGRTLVMLEVLVNDAPGSSNFVVMSTVVNDATLDTISVSIASEIVGEGDTDETENAAPPAVLAMCVHRNRLAALSGADNAVWMSKEQVEGEASGFPLENRVLFDAADGAPVGLASDGTSLFIAKRSKVYVLQGEGPGKDGSNPYAYPQPLPAEVGFAGPRAFVGTPDGILFQSAKGFHLLDRAGGVQPIPAADAYEALTVTGGVALDDRPYACLVTSDGTTLVWDWQLKQWYTWTGQAAAACCRSRNLFVFLGLDGKAWVETAGTNGDDGVAIQERVRFTWMNFAGSVLGFQRIWALQVNGEFMGSTTVNIRLGYDLSTATPTPYSKVVTTATLAPLELKPIRQECRQLQVTVDESSTTAGFKLSGFVFVVGADGRIRPVDPAQRMT